MLNNLNHMFSIFKKKYFLVDYLEDLTDMHCHILPDIDDGAKNSDISLEMIREYTDMGYVGAIATPHIIDGIYQNDSKKIKSRLNSLIKTKDKTEFHSFKLSAAAEYMLDNGFSTLMENNDLLTITKSKVLVEMSYFQQNIYVADQLFQLSQLGYEPILAHPERYVYLKTMDDILKFRKKGAYLQLNILSLSGHYGKTAHKQAINLLKNQHYDFVGTDAHHPRHLRKIKEIVLPKYMIPFLKSVVVKTKENLML